MFSFRHLLVSAEVGALRLAIRHFGLGLTYEYVMFAMPLLFVSSAAQLDGLPLRAPIRLGGFVTSCYCQVQISISGGFLLHTVAFRLATRNTFRISGLYFLLSFCSGLIFVEFPASQFRWVYGLPLATLSGFRVCPPVVRSRIRLAFGFLASWFGFAACRAVRFRVCNSHFCQVMVQSFLVAAQFTVGAGGLPLKALFGLRFVSLLT